MEAGQKEVQEEITIAILVMLCLLEKKVENVLTLLSGPVCATYVNMQLVTTLLPSPMSVIKNWTGSSKAMEPDMADEMMDKLAAKSISVETIVMDNDSSTVAKLRQKNPTLKKKSDKNHTKKNIANALYNLRKTHKPLQNSKTINYVIRMFSYAIAQMQGNVLGLKKRLAQLVPHMYGEHDECEEWCTYRRDPENFKVDCHFYHFYHFLAQQS